MRERTSLGTEPTYSASSRDWQAKTEGAKAHGLCCNSISRLPAGDGPEEGLPLNEFPATVIGLRCNPLGGQEH